MPENLNFTPNPNRSILIHGVIAYELIDNLLPQILKLQAESKDPITVYINSPGGTVQDCDNLLKLLKAGTIDSPSACQIITVAMFTAASAAAKLLVDGDYAVAYPWSQIYFHGVRVTKLITAEVAEAETERLLETNAGTAQRFAEKAFNRFLLRLVTSRGATFVQDNSVVLRNHIDFIRPKLSPSGKDVLQQTIARSARYNQLVSKVIQDQRFDTALNRAGARMAEVEAAMLHALVDLEVELHPEAEFRFSEGGLKLLSDDAMLIWNYLFKYSKKPQHMLVMWENYFLRPEDLAALDQMDQAVRPAERNKRCVELVKPIWTFLVALCHTLQTGENDLTALDAYWLGLIDEIISLDLNSPRLLAVAQQIANPPTDIAAEG